MRGQSARQIFVLRKAKRKNSSMEILLWKTLKKGCMWPLFAEENLLAQKTSLCYREYQFLGNA